MLDQVFGTYIQPACQTCHTKMSGESVAGWAMAVVGMVVVLLGIFMQLAARAAAPVPAATPAASQPRPVMDAVQREDLERRAAQAAQVSLAPQVPQARSGTPQDKAVSNALLGIGAGVSILGLIFAAIGAGAGAADNQLHSAAAALVKDSLDKATACVDSTGGGSELFPTSLLSNPYGSVPTCDPSPRSYTQQAIYDPEVPMITVEYTFSPSFTTNGEVTVHDPTGNSALCATVPDYSGGDPGSYISSGACPDAPVTEKPTS